MSPSRSADFSTELDSSQQDCTKPDLSTLGCASPTLGDENSCEPGSPECPSLTTCGPSEVRLLPTPSATPYGNNQSPSPGAAVRPSLDGLVKLLPTPSATEYGNQRDRSGKEPGRVFPSLPYLMRELAGSSSSPEASPAREPAAPVSATASTTPRLFYGTRCEGSSLKFDPATYSSKTSRTYWAWLRAQWSLLAPSGELWWGTWSRSGLVTSDGTVFPLLPSAPRTCVTGRSALLPTPTRQDGSNVAGASQEARNSPPLNALVRMLPTPRASERENRQTQRTPSQEAGAHGLSLLAEAASLLSGETTDQLSTDGKQSTDLRLNPSFVGWMMGEPTCGVCGRGWTDSDCPHSATAYTSTSGGSSESTS
jgi:hypothetical protein